MDAIVNKTDMIGMDTIGMTDTVGSNEMNLVSRVMETLKNYRVSYQFSSNNSITFLSLSESLQKES
jgi:hypothetical protein